MSVGSYFLRPKPKFIRSYKCIHVDSGRKGLRKYASGLYEYPLIIQITTRYHFSVYECRQDSTLALADLKRLAVCPTVAHCESVYQMLNQST